MDSDCSGIPVYLFDGRLVVYAIDPLLKDRMKLIIDEDVAKVAEFMRRNIEAVKLQRVSRALVQLGALIWPEQYAEDRFLAFRQELSPLEPDADSQRRPRIPPARKGIDKEPNGNNPVDN